MTTHLPQVIHTYQNHTLDSTRWQHYQPRPDDIIIATSYKSGTTWMQEIVRQLIFQGQNVPERYDMVLGEVSPWLDARWAPIEDLIGKLEAQQHRRFIKSHLALDGLPFYPQVKYIVVGRDVRDVGMSMWNHHSGYSDGGFEWMKNAPGMIGEPLPPATNVHDFWRNWISRGCFAWESEGYPYWGNMHHTQSWWAYHHLPNIHFVHYHDLKTNLAGELHLLADFLEIPLPDSALPAILQATSLDSMRSNAERVTPNMKDFWKEGAKTFFFKGTNGRWKDVLSAEDLALYEAKAAQVLTPDCRAWLEQGRVALDASL
ncbi:MAG: sulfotransferase domain-containing protein [Caldilineaceae bacterium]